MNIINNNNSQTGIVDDTHDPVFESFVATSEATSINHRRHRRGVRLVASSLALAAIVGGAFSSGSIAADDEGLQARAGHPAALPTASAEVGDDLWNRIRVLGLPRQWWEPVAIAMGLTPRGEWISADGLTWEHLDGRRIVVATPRTPTPTGDQTCS